MGQVKKAHVREAILASAQRLFSERGYHAASVPQIAAGAGVSSANVYVYFKSKIEMLYALYDPWMRARLAALEGELKAISDPFERLRHLLRTYWRDIPAEEGGYANNIIQAISAYRPGEGYRPDLLRWMERNLTRMVFAALPPQRRRELKRARLGHLLVMAFDGYSVYHNLNPRRPIDSATIDAMCAMLLGVPVPPPRAPPRRGAGGL